LKATLWLSGFVTVTLTGPATWPGGVALIEFGGVTVVAPAGVLPNLTVAPAR
jgi:hypothetical protein